LNGQYEMFASEEVLVPGMQQKVKKGEIISGAFRKATLEQLQNAHAELSTKRDFLKKTVDSMGDLDKQLQAWIEMEKILTTLETASFAPSPWFALPEKGKAKDLLLKQFAEDNELDFKEIPGAVLSMIKEMGTQGITLLTKLSKDQKLISRYEKQKE